MITTIIGIYLLGVVGAYLVHGMMDRYYDDDTIGTGSANSWILAASWLWVIMCIVIVIYEIIDTVKAKGWVQRIKFPSPRKTIDFIINIFKKKKL